MISTVCETHVRPLQFVFFIRDEGTEKEKDRYLLGIIRYTEFKGAVNTVPGTYNCGVK